MMPEVQLFKPEAGAESLAVPEELSVARPHIINAAAHLMKLYGLKRISCNVAMFGPCGTPSPTFEVESGFSELRPRAFDATTSSVVRALVPMLLVYGILGMTLSYADKDRVQVLELWSKMVATGKDADGNKKTSL